MTRWKRTFAGLLLGTAVVFGSVAVASCSDDGPDDPDVENIEGEPGNPTEDPDNPLDPTLPDDG